MENYKKFNANPHRGAYSLSLEATEQYENTREKIAKFINARNKLQKTLTIRFFIFFHV